MERRNSRAKSEQIFEEITMPNGGAGVPEIKVAPTISNK